MKNYIIKSACVLLAFWGNHFTTTAQVSTDFETTVITNHTLAASSFINDNEGWLADNNGKLWHTSNGGQSWDSAEVNLSFTKLDFVDAQTGFGIANNNAYKTTDGGSTWSALSLPQSPANGLFFLDEQNGFVSGYYKIFKTTDGGASWTTIETDSVIFLNYYFTNAATGFAAAYDDETNKCVWKTTDGGQTWSNVFSAENYFINSVWFTDDHNGWAAGYYNKTGRGKWPIINQTTDGGTTWKNIYMNRSPSDIKGEEFLAIRFKDALDGFALATYSQSLTTIDGGESWKLTYYDDGSQLIPSYGLYKSLSGINKMYLVGKQGTFTKWK